MDAKDIMSKDVVTVTGETTIKEVAQLLLDNKISGVPVVDEENNVVGMVTEGDLIYQDKKMHVPAFIEILGGVIYLENPNRIAQDIIKMTALTAEDIMTKKVHTVNEDTSVSEIASLMIDNNVNRLPVIDRDGKLKGIISRQDLVKSMA